MYLLQLKDCGGLSLSKHDDDHLPPYAILSHTWGADDDELKFSDVNKGLGKSKAGYAKVLFCGEQAKKNHLEYFWVDSCCIDKTNSAELSEAIISMFRYYENAAKCYVFLQDVSTRKRDNTGHFEGTWEAAFRKSRWFTRGWTLQELLAPRSVEFFSRDQHLLGSKESLQDLIQAITGIPTQALQGIPLSDFPTSERLRWADKRDTKRKEDKAYCLLGIFHVFIPILYGEGDYAFTRLQDEIRKTWNPLKIPKIGAGSSDEKGNEPDCASVALTQAVLDDRRRQLLESLSFGQMDARRSTIKNAQHRTCEWLLQHPTYVAWNTTDNVSKDPEILWIYGKPGAGKSTLVKFAYARAKQNIRKDEIIISFFFNARGEELEKTTIGMYRALLLQLLNEAPYAQHILDDVDSVHPQDGSPWTLELLQRLFSAAVASLGNQRIRCFIDALDECEEQQIRDMVEFFETLGDSGFGRESHLCICFASRHYPTIRIHHNWRIALEDEDGHGQDLEKYIRRRLQAGKGKALAEIAADIHRKANGVFMWTILVVDILNEEYRRGRIFAVKKRLQEIPPKLGDLFKEVLRRDCVNMDDLLLCLQWILFAKRPLLREEFYFAMASGLDTDHDHKPEPWDPDVVTIDHMSLFVLNASKGLAELTKSKTPTVQFIHESVRDFLVKDGGLCELWPELKQTLSSTSHNHLKQCCENYLKAGIHSSEQELPKAHSDEGKAFRIKVKTQFPFLEYANQNILYHADEAAQDIPQKSFVENFALDRYIETSNVLEQHDSRRYGPNATLTYVFAQTNCARLLGMTSLDGRQVRIPDQRYQFPLLTAFAYGCKATLQLLLEDSDPVSTSRVAKDPGFGKQASHVRSYQDPLTWAVQGQNYFLAEKLLRSGGYEDSLLLSNVSLAEKYMDLLLTAIKEGPISFVEVLLEKGAGMKAEESIGNKLLMWASSKWQHTKVQLLFDRGVKPSRGAFQAACEQSDEVMAQMLIDNYSEPNYVEELGLQDSLSFACKQGLKSIVRLLLGHGVKPSRKAFMAACEGGYNGFTQTLLEDAPNPNCLGELGLQDTPSAACQRRDRSNVRILKYYNHPKIGKGETRPFVDCQTGQAEVIQLLLDKDVNINPDDETYEFVLKFACSAGSTRIAQLLLDKGVDINPDDEIYGSIVQAAAGAGRLKIVQLLIDNGVQPNIQGQDGDALCLASGNGHESVVRLLLEGGAEVNSQGGLYGNALQAAVCKGDRRIVGLLLEKGAEVDSQGGMFRNALQAACAFNNGDIAELLIEKGAYIDLACDYYGMYPSLLAMAAKRG